MFSGLPRGNVAILAAYVDDEGPPRVVLWNRGEIEAVLSEPLCEPFHAAERRGR